MSQASQMQEDRSTDAVHVVLILEDEPVLRSSMVRGLAKLPSVEVVDAGTLADARRLIAATRPSLIISDLDLPDGNGVEVVAELDALGLRSPIMFVSAYVGTFGRLIPRRKNIVVLEKPVPLERLRTVVVDLLHVEVTSEQAPFSALEYIQVACMGRHSVRVCFIEGFEEVGDVTVCGGELWSARYGTSTGEDALRELVYGEGLRVGCRSLVGDAGERMFDDGWQSLLLEVSRVHDEAEWSKAQELARGGVVVKAPAAEELLDKEWGSMLDGLSEELGAPLARSKVLRGPSSAIRPRSAPLAKLAKLAKLAPPPVSGPELSASNKGLLGRSTSSVRSRSSRSAETAFDELYGQGIDALLAKRYDEAWHCFMAAAEIKTNRSLEANLKRLRALGYGGTSDE